MYRSPEADLAIGVSQDSISGKKETLKPHCPHDTGHLHFTGEETGTRRPGYQTRTHVNECWGRDLI
jgi:hypothetical protein